MNCFLRPSQMLLLSVFCLAISNSSHAQFLQVTDASTAPYSPPANLISNVFLGTGVEVTNIIYNGDPKAVGYFTGGTPSIGLDRGIVLTSGFAAEAVQPGLNFANNGNSGGNTEQSLAMIATDVLNDVAVYTITFIPNSDTLRFRYSFGSEEYPEYACSQFNDVFGFFIQGPGYPAFTNIARVPGTMLPVSINNVHPVNPAFPPCPPLNVQYYNDNELSSTQPTYDGFTDVFTAMAVVIPCQPYTIKLAISDVGDSAFDSAVFLEAKSFGTGSLRVDASTVSSDGTLAEGCSPGSITFSLPEVRSQNYPIVFNVFGSATPGADYQPIPTNLVIPAGQTTITVPIIAFEDNLPEGSESIAIAVQVDPCNLDTVLLYIRDKILQAPLLNDTSVCLPNTPVLLNATVPTPVPPAPTFSNQQDFPIPNSGMIVNSPISTFGVLPIVMGPGMIRSVCVNADHNWDDDLDFYLVAPDGKVLELSTDNGANGDDYTNTCFAPTAATVISFPGPFAPASAAPFTNNWLPEGPFSDLYGSPSNGNWRLQVRDDQNSITGTLLDWNITFEPSYNVNYSWSPAGGLNCTDCPNPIANISQTSTYNVTATDSYGCSVTEDIQISVGNLSASATVLQPILCFNQKGSVQAAAAGNNTYLWNTGQTTATLSNVAAGTYSVTVTSVGASCTATATVTLSQPSELFVSDTVIQVDCFGNATGSISAMPVGGVMPYSYAWNTAATTAIISSLSPNTYSVTVTDANGCTESKTFAVTQPSAIQIPTALKKDISCFGLSDGQITTYAVGGITPFSFIWNSGQTTQGINLIPAGTYTVTATDGNGCTLSKTETVSQPLVLSGFITPDDANCNGQNSGALHLEPLGGTPQYVAIWSGPNNYAATGTNVSNLFAGQYTAYLTDAHGCKDTLTATIAEPAGLLLALPEISDTICFAAASGTANASPSGGVSPYTYLWDAGGQTGQTATGLSTNEYHVTVTDANGCTLTGETLVLQQEQLNTYAESVVPGCHDGNDGTAAVLSIFYGATPATLSDFNYAWNSAPPQTGLNVTGLHAGQTYTVTATDAMGCTATATFQVGNLPPVETSIAAFSDTKCKDDATGWAAVQPDGGTAPYSFFWNGGTTPNDSLATGLSAGTYRVTITDANGCPGTASVTIGEPTLLRVQLEETAVTCFGESTGSIHATPSGGTSPYQYVWWNGTQTGSVNGLAAGTYGVSVTDANGCITPAIGEVREPAEALSGVSSMREPTCFGGHNGQILLTGAGGTPPYRYGIDNSPYNGSPVQIGISAGTFTPKLIDKNGCEFVLAPIDVTQPEQVFVDLGPDIQILFGRDTQLVAVVENAHGAVSYAWSLQDSVWLSCLDCLNPAIYSLEYPTYFEVIVTDSAGCRAEDQILVSVEKPRRVFVPTGFTPNGDFNNDLLLVHGQSSSKALNFKVFDRWGEMVYERRDFPFNDDADGWDGNFKGKPCDPGVYVWILEVEYVDGVTEIYKGDTTLIR